MADLDLPPGPLVAHLQAAHRLTETLADALDTYGWTPSPEAVVAHGHHMRKVAAYTAAPRGGPVYPRPEPLTPGEGRREGWDLLLADRDGTVMAGWDDSGRFYLWSPAEHTIRALAGALTAALQEATRG